MNQRFGRYGLGAAIAGIFLLAIFGVWRSAAWLSQTTPEPEVTVGSNRVLNGDPEGGLSDRNEGFGTQGSASNNPTSRRSAANDAANDNGRSGELGQVTNTFSPLEEAGTYIQRQKRVERDPVVAASQVSVTTLADSTPTAAQNDSRVTQPSAADTQAAQPSPTAPASQAVPALW